MSEIKTLNDIIPYDKMSNDGSCQDMIDKNELRQVVIKWIKKDIEDSNSNDWMVNRWKERFNITEEDLK